MKEKIISGKKNGMGMMLLTIFLYIISIFAAIVGTALESFVGDVIVVLSVIWMSLGWIMFMGLKVLKPQEALVLTLFGKYIGTLKGDGFYWVNPFCTAFNPAASTRLRQSGDVAAESSS